MEPLVMEAMSWAAKPTVDSVHPQEPNVLACREYIKSTLTAALQPVHEYIAKVQVYSSWLTVDPAAYLAGLQASLSHLALQACMTWLVIKKPICSLALAKTCLDMTRLCSVHAALQNLADDMVLLAVSRRRTQLERAASRSQQASEGAEDHGGSCSCFCQPGAGCSAPQQGQLCCVCVFANSADVAQSRKPH